MSAVTEAVAVAVAHAADDPAPGASTIPALVKLQADALSELSVHRIGATGMAVAFFEALIAAPKYALNTVKYRYNSDAAPFSVRQLCWALSSQ